MPLTAKIDKYESSGTSVANDLEKAVEPSREDPRSRHERLERSHPFLHATRQRVLKDIAQHLPDPAGSQS
jgi:hypothetical protein